MSDNRATPPRSNWAISQRNMQSSGLYALALIDLQQLFGGRNNSVIPSSRISAEAILEFAFKVNPKSLGLEEPGAVTIVPLQDGDQYVENQGSIYKNITLNGTTGLRPNRTGTGAIVPIIGIQNPFATFDPNSETGLPQGERTGFDDLIDLRNLVRLYWDIKRDPDFARTTVMVWQNGKEGEYFIVEPIVFKTDRDASSPLTFSYTIQLRTLSRLDVAQMRQLSDFYGNLKSPTGFFARISNIKRKLTAAFNVAYAFTDRTASIAQSTVSDVLSPVNDVIQALTGLVTSGQRFTKIPQNALAPLAQSCIEGANALNNVINNPYTNEGWLTQYTQVANAYLQIARQLTQLANEPSAFVPPLSSTISAKWKSYADPVTGMPATGGSPTALGNTDASSGAAVTAVGDNETIRDISKRVLGDAAKWKVLVLLNKLRQPYISPAGDGVNVLRPGDQILFPRAAQLAGNVAPTQQKFSALSPLEQRLGRDLALTALQSSSGDVTYSLSMSRRGDLDVVEGFSNLDQAIVIKFATEQGELPTHPFFGLKFPLGTKGTIQALVAFNINARATLLSDNRIGSVDRLSARITGNVLNVTGALTVKGFDQAQNFDFSVRR